MRFLTEKMDVREEREYAGGESAFYLVCAVCIYVTGSRDVTARGPLRYELSPGLAPHYVLRGIRK